MNATTVGVDLAKNRFELAVADADHRIRRRERLSRAQFQRFFGNFQNCRIVMESCGSSQYWARTLGGFGHEVQILPAQYVRAYVKRNKTDAADAAALIEVSRCGDIRCVPIKSVEHQLIQQLHRMRSNWVATRTARINQLRGCLREFGIAIAQGAERGLAQIREQLAIADNGLPDALRPVIADTLREIAELHERAKSVEHQLKILTREDPIVQRLMRVPGVGLLTATALRAAIVDIHRFGSGRYLACWLGITARESSSGERRRLGRISKRGDSYLRTLLIHGARSVLNAAIASQKRGRSLDRLRSWAVLTQQRRGYNKATVALANKLARIVWATWKYERDFDGNWAVRSEMV